MYPRTVQESDELIDRAMEMGPWQSVYSMAMRKIGRKHSDEVMNFEIPTSGGRSTFPSSRISLQAEISRENGKIKWVVTFPAPWNKLAGSTSTNCHLFVNRSPRPLCVNVILSSGTCYRSNDQGSPSFACAFNHGCYGLNESFGLFRMAHRSLA